MKEPKALKGSKQEFTENEDILEGFEILPKKYDYLESNQLKVSHSTIRFGENLRRAFKDSEHCEIHFNKEKKLIAFKGVNESVNGFLFTQYKALANSERLKKVIPRGIFKAEVKEGIVLLNISRFLDEIKDFWKEK